MIYGIGTDILTNNRMNDYERCSRLANKILSETELEIFQSLNKSQALRYLTKQFTCKEAVSKAFGTGIRYDVVMSNMEISRDILGKPVLKPLGNLISLMENMGISNSYITISDTNEHTIAVCVLEKGWQILNPCYNSGIVRKLTKTLN